MVGHGVRKNDIKRSWLHRGINYGTFLCVLLEWPGRLKSNRSVCRKFAKVFLKRRDVQSSLLEGNGLLGRKQVRREI